MMSPAMVIVFPKVSAIQYNYTTSLFYKNFNIDNSRKCRLKKNNNNPKKKKKTTEKGKQN